MLHNNWRKINGLVLSQYWRETRLYHITKVVSFNIFLEYVIKGVKSLNRDFQLNENMSVYIRYAEDTTLISAVFDNLQLSTLELEQSCQKCG